jgi:putative hydrolase of the HAD superfamily
MVIVFDLDDTLYEEMAFVKSGFAVVAAYLSLILHLDSEEIFRELMIQLNKQREKVFDRFFEKRGIKNQQLVNRCLSLYRGHEPDIHLYPAARACLENLQNYPLYIVTDGNKLVQKKKFLTLGLDRWVRRCFCTYAYGLHHSKPSPYCFEKICQIEQVVPSQVVYIADNPKKDFVGIKPLGFHTIRVLTGPYRKLVVDQAYEADILIHSLAEVNSSLLMHLMDKRKQRK